ncbi:unnamed protein product, partial [Ascophyllum nodosum]
AVRNQSEIETSLKMRGMSPFLFVKLVKARTGTGKYPFFPVQPRAGLAQPYTVDPYFLLRYM